MVCRAFFFQAEDGIRDTSVTGVQTCALPILIPSGAVALSYHPQTPTAPLGITGFDVGFALTGARLHNTAVLERASSDSEIGRASCRERVELPVGAGAW